LVSLGTMTDKKPPPIRMEDQPWYQQWRNALERVIAASMAVDATMVGTPERLVAKHEHEAALAEFRKIAKEIR
jgi:hypothetical protein